MATHTLPPPGTRRGGTATGCPTDRPSRRELLNVAGFCGLTAIAAVSIAKPDAQAVEAAPTAHNNDVELIAIGREAAALAEQRKPLEARWWAIPKPSHVSGRLSQAAGREAEAVSVALQPIDDRIDEMSERVMGLRATCREALAAKAQLIRYEMRLVHVFDGVMDLEELSPDERIVWSLLDDLLEARS